MWEIVKKLRCFFIDNEAGHSDAESKSQKTIIHYHYSLHANEKIVAVVGMNCNYLGYTELILSATDIDKLNPRTTRLQQ